MEEINCERRKHGDVMACHLGVFLVDVSPRFLTVHPKGVVFAIVL